MKKYAMRVGSAVEKRPLRMITRHSLYVCQSEAMLEVYIKSGYKISDDIEDFLNALCDTTPEYVLILGTSASETEEILDIIKDTVIQLSVYSNLSDLSQFSECKRLKELFISTNAGTVVLPNLISITEIAELELSLDATRLENVKGLKSSSLKSLEIRRGSCSGFAPVPTTIEDISFLLEMPKLERLTMLINSKEDKSQDLLVLSRMNWLKQLNLTPDYFSMEQYAWLSSKLEGVEGLSGVYYSKWDRYHECMRVLWLGEPEKMMFEPEERASGYVEKFRALREKYKLYDNPPTGEES